MRTKTDNSIRFIKILLVVLTLSLIAVFALSLVLGGKEQTSDMQTDTEKNAGSISIPGYEGLTLKADSKRQDISLKNPSNNNCYLVITLSLEDGTELWKSEMIKPGRKSKPIKLNRELAEGNYSARLVYECYRMDEEKTPLNGAETKLTLRVKNKGA